MHASNKPFVLGLTGGIGCGKTTAAEHLEALGAYVVDADRIAHELYEAGGTVVESVRARFGENVFGADGSIDRRKLSDIVFAHADARRALESITHPAIQREIVRQMDAGAEQGVKVIVLNVPLLYECGMDAMCDAVWVISAEPEQQIIRVMNRDHVTRDSVLLRCATQMPAEQKEALCDRVIPNTKTTLDLKNEITHSYHELLRRLG